MNVDPASMAPHPHRTRTTRADRAAGALPWLSDRTCIRLSLAALALGFVVLGADGLDVGPGEARLGLAAGGSVGPMGQVFGYWAPDLWPAEVLPSIALARLSPGSRANSAVVRWPSAMAAILGGWILSRGMHRSFGFRGAIWVAVAWFSCLAVIDRSAGAGLDMILGVATLAAIDRLLGRGADWVAGLWASLAFLAGGWPPLMLIGLTIIVIGRPGSRFSAGLVLPPLATAIGWSSLAIRSASTEAWAAAMAMPLTRGLDGDLIPGLLLLGLPWAPFALIALSRSTRDAWPASGRAWVKGWLQAALACAIAGTAVPGLGPAARIVALAGLLVAAAAGLESGWRRTIAAGPRRTLLAAFSIILTAWLVAMIYGCFIWILTMPYYRTLGIIMSLIVLGVAYLGWSALSSANTRRCVVTLVFLAIGLKLAHWGYYAPEWNYRFSQGPWGRAIGQWIPRKWAVYTFGAVPKDDWPPDLAFFIGRPVRQLRSPRFLNYVPGRECHFVLLRAADFAHWPDHAPPLSLVARFLDRSGDERILARTPGLFPLPGRNDPRPSANTNDPAPLSSVE
jgi:hypothetical protein